MKEHDQKHQSMNSSDPKGVVKILEDLIRFPCITPAMGEIFDYLEMLLKPLGFHCERFTFGSSDQQVENLFAHIGEGSPHFCFAGHVDVVPPGDLEAWSNPAFEPLVKDNTIYGRGAVDMKGAIAAFLAASMAFLSQDRLKGKLSLLITGDEEGPAIYGTCKVLEILKERGDLPDFCLVGEPTSENQIGDTIKIGRRGSLTGKVSVKGIQGHVAYPQVARNPIHELIQFLNELKNIRWDEGDAHFQPSNLEIISLSPFNETTNLIPDQAAATFNIRYNTKWTRQRLIDEITKLKEKTITEGEIVFPQGSEPVVLFSNGLKGNVSLELRH